MRLLKWQILISISLIAFVIGCFMTYVIFIKNDLFFSNITIAASIISGVGSVLGGLIGGVVAFGIARSQFVQNNNREQEKRKQSYLNLLKSLKTELKHNERILNLIVTNNSKRDDYIKLLSTDAWNNIKYNSNNFLPTTIYTILDEQSRDFKDIQEAVLPEYADFTERDFDLRMSTIKKTIKEIENEEKRLQK